MQIQLVDDHLTEREEWFGIQLSSASPSVNVIDTQLLLYIEPSDGMYVVNHTQILALRCWNLRILLAKSYDICIIDDSHCSEGSVIVVSDVNNSSPQLVEMCYEGVWSPVCDSNWTLQDATVVCRELGYRNSGNYIDFTLMHDVSVVIIK